jgi:hypothetical protein
MYEPCTPRLEGSAPFTGLAPQTAGLVTASDRRSTGCERGHSQPVDDTGPCRWPGRSPPSPTSWGSLPVDCRAMRPHTGSVAARSRRLWLPRRALEPRAGRDHHPPGIWRLVSSAPCGPLARRAALEPAKTGQACPAARRSGQCTVAGRHLAGHQKGAQVQQQTILFIDESGFYPLPSVVRTYAPVGQTPILKEWWTRDHLSAISASSPEGKLYFHSQDHPINLTTSLCSSSTCCARCQGG